MHPCPLIAALPTCCVLHCHADTDMEAEVEPSVEGEEALRAEEAAAQQRLAQLARWVCMGLSVGSPGDMSLLLMVGCQLSVDFCKPQLPKEGEETLSKEEAAAQQCLAQMAR